MKQPHAIYSIIFLLATLCVMQPAAVLAQSAISGHKDIILVDKQGNQIPIGKILFKQSGMGSSYVLHIDHAKFTDYFLSMKEMKCLEGPELWCHIPYPYTQPKTVTPTDMRWLEHDLLFMFKKKEAFGANFWNGIYYRMHIANDVIRGEAQAVDLNLLASPPADLEQPPIGDSVLDEIDPDTRWLPGLEIR
jgi:hypothetical protein